MSEEKKAYEVRLRSNETIMLLLDEEGKKRFESALFDRGRMFISMGERTISRTEVRDFYPVRIDAKLPVSRRLESPEDKEENIDVPGGWQKPSSREGMKTLFDKLQNQGIASQFISYEDWEKIKYEKKV